MLAPRMPLRTQLKAISLEGGAPNVEESTLHPPLQEPGLIAGAARAGVVCHRSALAIVDGAFTKTLVIKMTRKVPPLSSRTALAR